MSKYQKYLYVCVVMAGSVYLTALRKWPAGCISAGVLDITNARK